MWKTILRRVILMIPQIIVLSLFVFLLAKMMPGDPFTGLITPTTSASQIARLRKEAGLDNPWYVQYVDWVGRALHGDFGMSYQMQRPVTAIIGERAINTLYLSVLSVILTYLIGIPLGVWAGRYEGTGIDTSIQFYNFISMSTPPFVVYLLAIAAFGFGLSWFPTSGSVSVNASGFFGIMISRLYHIILPSLLIAFLGNAGIVQYLRSGIVDNKLEDYVKTARSKGVPERVVFNKHILRNSLLPIAAFFGNVITGLLSGSVFAETIFSYPGMGKLFVDSVGGRDYSIMTALILLYGILTLLGNLLSDIIMSIVDPRIRID
ncbi:ABC transporter permease [Schleiferilactobacillus harbinensis]|uniref:ABC transporter permease n=1 Tax=Schleiferilactobacillus harbinensis TaxID=304207 RepID=UPI001AAF4383|nr:ABC transporter permease [Schleiferilactobacillus harbinensis]MBO3091032.1 ABC transporter permease [Schleiferilactobacillus harbinensis]